MSYNCKNFRAFTVRFYDSYSIRYVFAYIVVRLNKNCLTLSVRKLQTAVEGISLGEHGQKLVVL